MVTDDKKREFALRLLEARGDAHAAALRCEPYDVPTRLYLLTECPGDPLVRAEMDRIVAEQGQAAFLPDKDELAAAIFERARKAKSDDDAFKGFKLYADVRGYIEKPGTTIDNRTLVDNRSVVVVKDFGSDDEWEAKLKAQQTRLIEQAAEPVDQAA